MRMRTIFSRVTWFALLCIVFFCFALYQFHFFKSHCQLENVDEGRDRLKQSTSSSTTTFSYSNVVENLSNLRLLGRFAINFTGLNKEV